MTPESHFESEADLRRYDALLRIADLIVHPANVAEFLPEIVQLLRTVARFEVANISLYDPEKNSMRLHFWEGKQVVPEIAEVPMADAACGLALQRQEPVVWSDVYGEEKFELTLDLLKKKGVRSYCTLPLSSAERRLGVLGLGCSDVGVYGDGDVRLLSGAAKLVALALENAITRAAFRHESERLEAMLRISASLLSSFDVHKIFPAISNFLRKVSKHDYASITLYDRASLQLVRYALDAPFSELLRCREPLVLQPEPVRGPASLGHETKIYNQSDLAKIQSGFLARLLEHGVLSVCSIPLITRFGAIGTLDLASRREKAFLAEDIGFLEQVAGQVAAALDNSRAHSEIALLTERLAKEKLYREDEVRTELNFVEIVGQSAPLKNMLKQIETVAPSDATVLILGETGTGKELIAHAIHRISPRKDASFIKLNCAAIPTGLLESELFGHEKGAFTGAVTQKIGRLELADKGTLFLDEVGDIPMEIQPKLLRVLQDQEFERLGSTRTLKVNIRLIAATNRDLAKRVAEREFRSDLYYRLHVFPVRMPALRERPTDIPLLVRYFVQRFARRMGKQIDEIPTDAMDALMRWEWPGNVRELENFIERSVILTNGTTLRVPTAELIAEEDAPTDGTLESFEREHIVRALRESHGVIAGPHGAAARLGLKRTTLQSRIARMGITHDEYSG